MKYIKLFESVEEDDKFLKKVYNYLVSNGIKDLELTNISYLKIKNHKFNYTIENKNGVIKIAYPSFKPNDINNDGDQKFVLKILTYDLDAILKFIERIELSENVKKYNL